MTRASRLQLCIVGCCLAVVLHSGAAGGEVKPSQPLLSDAGSQLSGSSLEYLETLDIVVVVDNSSDMVDEVRSFEDYFFINLVAPMIAYGVDTRVIVVSRHGDSAQSSICFEAPLSNIPPGGCTIPPPQPGINDIFKHYSVEVGSHDAWCLLISTFDGTVPDEFGLAPTGWVDWLRGGALKVILMVSNDGVLCGAYDDDDSVPGGLSTAAEIDSDLLALSPLYFGTGLKRNYVVHSLVGLAEYTVSGEPWPPSAPVTASSCAGAMSAGTGHQATSVLTQGLRYPSCSTDFYDVFLIRVHQDTIQRLPFFADGFESGDTSAWSSVNP